ncbi:MAG: winged helix-turn-helix transcriptional regulator [Mariniphaga sp.]|nr:winged helix-turn-helix transcriptional regulator [Mariniphaga sp.]
MQNELKNIPISYLVYQTERAIHHSINLSFQKAGIPLLIEQWPVLTEIFNENGLTQQELANKTKKDKTTLTRIINTLEKNGLVKRGFDKSDRRKKLICSTEKAEQMKLKIIELLKIHNQKALIEIEKTNIDTMRETMFTILKNLDWEFEFKNIKCIMK